MTVKSGDLAKKVRHKNVTYQQFNYPFLHLRNVVVKTGQNTSQTAPYHSEATNPRNLVNPSLICDSFLSRREKSNKGTMAGSRERLLYERRPDYEYEYEFRRRYEQCDTGAQRQSNRYNLERRRDVHERPRRKNGYVYEDIYSDFDEAQGRLSLFRPIRPEYLNLPTTYDIKYNSLPRNYYNYEDRNNRRYKKDHYDFRIENERRTRESYESYRKAIETRPKETNSNTKISLNVPTHSSLKSTPKNVAVCKPHRITDKNARYWTTDPPERGRNRPKKPEEQKKNVKFSEVSGCNRKMVVDDPICGRKLVPVRELEVSLDQMIQNGYFEKHNIPIAKPIGGAVKEEAKGAAASAVPNGKCLSGNAGKENQLPRKTRHLPQVRPSFFTNRLSYFSLS